MATSGPSARRTCCGSAGRARARPSPARRRCRRRRRGVRITSTASTTSSPSPRSRATPARTDRPRWRCSAFTATGYPMASATVDGVLGGATVGIGHDRRRRPQHGDDVVDGEVVVAALDGGRDDGVRAAAVDVVDIADRRRRLVGRARSRRAWSRPRTPAAGSGKANAGQRRARRAAGRRRPPISTVTIGLVAPAAASSIAAPARRRLASGGAWTTITASTSSSASAARSAAP